MTQASFWAPRLGSDIAPPLAGDADGDGRADLFRFQGPGGIPQVILTSPLGKPRQPRPLAQAWGHTGLAFACADFTGTKRASLLGVFPNGNVRVITVKTPAGGDVSSDISVAAVIPAALRPTSSVQAMTGDFDGDGKNDVLLVGKEGEPLFLHNITAKDATAPTFAPQAVPGVTFTGLRRVAAGSFAAGGTARVIWLDAKGTLWRTVLPVTSGEKIARSFKVREGFSPDDLLLVGHFRGRATADIIVGQRLLPGGDGATQAIVLSGLPAGTGKSLGDVAFLAADIDGNGRDDIIRTRGFIYKRREQDIGDDASIHFCYDPASTDRGYLSTANDGIPDLWKTGKIKPHGVDIAALGARPGRQSVILELQPDSDVNETQLKAIAAQAIEYYASLPTINPDGSRGISLHILYGEAIPVSESRPQAATDTANGGRRRRPTPEEREATRKARNQRGHTISGRYHRPESHGIEHWMHVHPGGGGLSKVMGDEGRCSADLPVLLHEFGHQLGLGHHGGWDADFSPLYASCMNYNYKPEGAPDKQPSRYSLGRMRSLVLYETDLSERLPFPIEWVSYLAGKPYRFTLRPTPDGRGTLVDWNRNGRLGEEHVRADINCNGKIDTEPMGDHDDITIISGFGLSRSISYLDE